MWGKESKPLRPTQEDLDYIAKTTSGAKCPFCNTDKWASHISSEDGVSQVQVQYINPDKSYMLPTIPLSCETCGFMRLHDLAMVRAKVRGWK